MIACPVRLDIFFRKHKKKKSIQSMVRRKNDLIGEINDQINSQKYVFNERTSVIWKGKLLTFYKKWEDRFVDFCLYRHLNERKL